MDPNWTLALEQQTDLTATHGCPTALAGVLRRGASLRLYMTTEDYEETLFFQQTYVGSDDHFAGIMSQHHSFIHRGNEIDQPYVSIFSYDASGRYTHIKWMTGDVALNESQAYPYGIYRWFIQDRWRTVYRHDAKGNRIAGDLDQLLHHARSGHSIQVGVHQLFGLADDDPTGPQHISFLSTRQPMIADGHLRSNCDLVAVGAPRWPIDFANGLHVSVMLPSTSGEMLCFLAQPGKLPFKRTRLRRPMTWMVSDT